MVAMNPMNPASLRLDHEALLGIASRTLDEDGTITVSEGKTLEHELEDLGLRACGFDMLMADRCSVSVLENGCRWWRV